MLPLFIPYKSSGEKLIKYQANLSCVIMYLIDLSRIPVHKGTNSRLGWAKYSDLYEIVYLPHTHFFMFAHGTVMRERFILTTTLFYKALILQGEI